MTPGKVSVFIGREVRVDRAEAENIRHSIEPAAASFPEPSAIVSDIAHNLYNTDDEALDGVSVSENGESNPGNDEWSDHEREKKRIAPAVTSRRQKRRSDAPRRSTRLRTTTVSSARLSSTSTGKMAKTKVSKTTSTSVRTPQKRQSKRPLPDDEWEVDKVVDDRIDAETYVHYYLVQWKGWAPKHNTWEPKRNLSHCWSIIEEYEAQGQRGQGGK
ncbi:hypothetical protein Purlil1_12201 [Purpureocillium lilacinum]|uniref:Chromo domain-containing protein n=1 Tax=Purpureocillium lilacinum TaxID=33203 RepID=A0ABR0BHJ2_PURLI|nr:hypothetical protein Purlil1_12201 [Purpureocillium lilacinum]GJN70548.1 hypothetical protein PLICBS_004606 [Purpureocillium lilacinum]